MKKNVLILITIAILSAALLSCSKNNNTASSDAEKSNIEETETPSDISSEEPPSSEDSSMTETDSDSNKNSQGNNTDNKNTYVSSNDSSKADNKNNSESASKTNSNSSKSDSAKAPNKNNQSESLHNPSTISKDPDSEVYTSPLGFSITFPSSWKGLYEVTEDSSSLSVHFKQSTAGDYGQGLLFTVQAKTDDFDENTLDSIGSKRYIVAENVLYVIGGPTDINFSPDSPDFESFNTMHHQCGDVINTIKILN